MYKIVDVIRKLFPSLSQSFSRRIASMGKTIAQTPKSVTLSESSPESLTFSVQDSGMFTADISLSDERVELFCTCPEYGQTGKPCRHLFAALYSMQYKLIPVPEEDIEFEEIPESSVSAESLFELLDKGEHERQEREENLVDPPEQSWNTMAVLFRAPNGGVTFQLGQGYVKNDGSIGRFREFSSTDLGESFGGILIKELNDSHRPRLYTDTLRGRILEWISKEKLPLWAADSDGSWHRPKLKIRQKLSFKSDHTLQFLQEDSEQFTLLPMVCSEENEQFPITADMEMIASDPVYLLDGSTIIPLRKIETPSLVKEFISKTPKGESAKITIPSKLQDQFHQKYAPLLAKNGTISKETLETFIIDEPPTPELYLSEPSEGSLRVSLQFRYGDILLLPGDENITRRHGSRILKIIRSEATEMNAMKRLIQANLTLSTPPDLFVPKGHPLQWVVEQLPQLKNEGWPIFGEKDLVSLQAVRLTPTVSVGINARNDWFDTSLDIRCDGEPLPLHELQAIIRGQETGYRDSSGRWVTISQQWIDRFRPLFDSGYESDGKGLISIPRVHWSAVDQLFEKMRAEVNLTLSAEEAIEQYRAFQGVKEIPVEPTLKATLRPYQKAGYDWLISLQKMGSGGCLADDMGLGKTVMTIALLCREYVNSHEPTLIVAPTSVLFNWKRELEKFAPHLSVSLYYGSERKLENTDIVLTSYALLRNDIKKLNDIHWHYVILDEAQAIKNPAAQTTKAARMLKSNHRLALSGTPIENGLTELWSLFSFINPGLLFSEKVFKENFVKDIEKEKRSESASYLHRLVHPFILRRTKELVTPELPPKTETILVEEMSAVQKELYAKVRDTYREELIKKMKNKRQNKLRIDVLAGLMRLRQICCHPGLFDKMLAHEDSSKFDMLDSLLEDIASEGHRVLIFSQFVGMLKLTEERLKKQDITSIKLTGRTRNREQVVEKFRNDDSITAFLISLKAGGTGLNLVEADYVIHLDPWWNPAVEDQASDRAYRIGQTKPVFIYKCVMKDSVEEKILTLQSKKRDLTESIITTDESIVKSLSADDIISLFS